MPGIEVNIEVYCARCGEGLCNQTESTTTRTRREPCFRVEPCKKCLDEAREEGHSSGYDEGFNNQESEGELL